MTVTQMKYFMALTEEYGDKSRNIAEVARMFNVNRSTVSRAIAPFVDEGVLNDNFMLTEMGKIFLLNFNRKYESIKEVLESEGVMKEQAQNDALLILVECSDQTSDFISRIGKI